MTQTTVSGPFQEVDMPAVDLRQAFQAVVTTEGVSKSSDFAVTQRGAGANMSVDVAGGSAMIADDHGGVTGGGFFSYTQPATINVPISASDPTNPRIDRLVIRVRDHQQGDATNAFDLFVVAGTPTAGATLVNCNGAGAVPNSCLLIANILVGAAVASIVTANVDSTGGSNNNPKVRPLIGIAGTPSSYVSVYDRVTGTTDVVSSVTETSLYTRSILAGDMSTNKTLRLTMIGDYLHNNVAADTVTLRIKFGGTTFWGNATSLQAVIGAPRHPWVMTVYVTNLGLSNSQMIAATLLTELSAVAAPTLAGIGGMGTSQNNSPISPAGITTFGTIDTTANQSLDITAQWSASSVNNSWRIRTAILELV